MSLVQRVAPDAELVTMLTGFFEDYRTARGHVGAEVDFDAALWAALQELGLSRLTAPESEGGSGAGWAEAATLLGLAAGAAAPVPLVEHDLLAGWLLRLAGVPATDGRLRTAVRTDSEDAVCAVPYAHDAVSIVVLNRHDGRTFVSDIPASELTITPGRNRAGEPYDVVDLSGVRSGMQVADETWLQFQLRGALARSAQIAGGMERALEVVSRHANERVQFGRPLGKFQAVQNMISDIATETALTRAAVDSAIARVARSDWSDAGIEFFVATAASCAGHASSTVVRNAHQVIAAIGTTLEHELHTLTLPILARRGEFGSVRSWDERLTRLAAAAGDNLWALVTTGVPSV
ncbi:MAG TPA: acyl-CoA dehydrogenase family protein [Jatrophihabitans sp.]|jgi:acyl-CoA dehydrogenase